MWPSSMFFQAWSHSGEKTSPSLPSPRCSVSRGQPVTGRHLQTARCQDSFDTSVMKSVFRFLWHRTSAHSSWNTVPSLVDSSVDLSFILCLSPALWQEQMDTPTLKTCKVEEDLRPWPGETHHHLLCDSAFDELSSLKAQLSQFDTKI